MHSRNRWLVLGILSSALLLIVIDLTVLYTALPRLTRDLGASSQEKLWIVNAYALAVAGLLPGMGALGDRHGAKRLFLSGLVVFGCASLMAAFAPTPGVLIAARVVLAVGAAMMMPATLSIIRQVFAEPQEQALAIGVWSAVAAGGAALGPVVGGVLLEYYWWGAVFLINLPIVLVACVLGLGLIPRSSNQPGRPFDLWASVQVMAGLIGVVYAVKEAGTPESSPGAILLSGTVGVVFLSLFVRRQRRTRHPILDLGLFRDRGFTAAVVAALTASGALVSVEFAVSQRFQLALGLSPLEAALAMLPLPLAAFVAGPLTGTVLFRFGAMWVLRRALAVIALGILGYLALLDAGMAAQVGMLLVIGGGLGVAMTAASTTIMQKAPVHRAGGAASIEEVSYELGGAIGIAVLGSLMAAVYSGTFEVPLGASASAAARDSFDAALVIAQNLKGGAAEALVEAAGTAFQWSFVAVMTGASVWLLAVAAWMSLFVRRRARGPARLGDPIA